MANITTRAMGYAFLANFGFYLIPIFFLVGMSYFGSACSESDGSIYAKNERRGALLKGTDARFPPAR